MALDIATILIALDLAGVGKSALESLMDENLVPIEKEKGAI